MPTSIAFVLLAFSARLSHCQSNPFEYKVQFIGHTRYVSPYEEVKRDFCENFWCTNDAFYIFTKASQYVDQDPCVDFRNFTLARTIEIDAIDDRYTFRGFQSLVQDIYSERERKTAKAKVDEAKDSRATKIVKNLFQTCLKSRHPFRHLDAHREVIARLQALGGSHFLGQHRAFNPNRFDEDKDYRYDVYPGNVSGDGFWDASSFNFSLLFAQEPAHSLNVFFDLAVTRCKSRKAAFRDVLCLDRPHKEVKWQWSKDVLLALNETFEVLEDRYLMAPQFRRYMREAMTEPAMWRLREFVEARDEVASSCGRNEATVTTVAELAETVGEVDWLGVVNSQLFEEAKVGKSDGILLRGGLECVRRVMELIRVKDKKILADTFVLTYLYFYRDAIILRLQTRAREQYYGVRHQRERWKWCIWNIRKNLNPAFLVMYEEQRPRFERTLGDFDRLPRVDQVEGVKGLIGEAVKVAQAKFVEGNRLPLDVAAEILKKLKKIKVFVGMKGILEKQQLEWFYGNLQLAGNESYLHTLRTLLNHEAKIKNLPKTNNRRRIDEMARSFVEYYNIGNGNYIYLSPIWAIYPWFHTYRPRFFNMATTFADTINAIHFGILEYVKEKHGMTTAITGLDWNNGVAYETYDTWLKNNTDLQIGANYLTNRQLFWVAAAFSHYAKHNKRVPNNIDPLQRVRDEFLHIHYKVNDGFQEAFECEFTEEEDRLWDVYIARLAVAATHVKKDD